LVNSHTQHRITQHDRTHPWEIQLTSLPTLCRGLILRDLILLWGTQALFRDRTLLQQKPHHHHHYHHQCYKLKGLILLWGTQALFRDRTLLQQKRRHHHHYHHHQCYKLQDLTHPWELPSPLLTLGLFEGLTRLRASLQRLATQGT
jgi:hypothetical protein